MIPDLLTNVKTDSKHIVEEKQISLEVEINTRSINTVYCDEKRIQQVLSNLIKNSIDFVPKKKGKVILTVEEGEGEKEENDIASINNNPSNTNKTPFYIIFTVKDNGEGIPKNKVDNLFTKFYHIDTSATRKHGGTGLGLVICKGIVESHGGKIWVDKIHTNGFSIKFSIPINHNI